MKTKRDHLVGNVLLYLRRNSNNIATFRHAKRFLVTFFEQQRAVIHSMMWGECMCLLLAPSSVDRSTMGCGECVKKGGPVFRILEVF